jgi:cytochrome c oxidase cbb3-type subunit 3
MKRILFLLLLDSLALAQLGRVGAPSSANPLARDPKAVAAGEKSFQRLCTGCHGRGGEGGQGEGKGPNLMNSWEIRRASDRELFAYIHDGVSGTAMPAFALPDQSIHELAAFVRSLNAPANSVPVIGDAHMGEAVFSGKGGCTACHMIRGHGGYLGPDLSEIGAKRRLGELRDAIIHPDILAIDGFKAVMLPNSHGTLINGIVKQESNWSMSVLDETGQLHLLRANEMRNVVSQPRQWMPEDYSQRLSADEIQDLLAYLSQQTLNQATARMEEPK